MLDTLLNLDKELLISASTLLDTKYALLIQVLGESIVLWCGGYLIGLWMYGVKRNDNRYKIDAMMIFSTIILTFIVYSIINLGFDAFRKNPQDILTGIKPLINHPTENSFPSGHSLFTGAFLVGLYFFSQHRWIIGISIIFGLLTAFARVVGGVHYPGDILAGWFFGFFGGILFAYVVSTGFFRAQIYSRVIALARYLKL